MSFQQGLSGLNATSKSLDVIGNNIANSNTYGAKVARAEFSDVYSAALGGAGSNAVGIGTSLASISQQFTQGTITTTENPLDLAINGGGFFQVTDGKSPIGYTRNGQFKVDRDGYIVNNNQQRLVGYVADNTGTILPGAAQAIKLPTNGVEPQATSKIDLAFNLDSRAGTYTPPAAGPQVDFFDPATFTNATSQTVYDAKGQEVALTYYFQKSASDSWNVFVTANGQTLAGTAAAPQRLFEIGFAADGSRIVSIGDPAAPLVADPVTGDFPPAEFAFDIPATTNSSGASTLPILGIDIDLTPATQFGSGFGVTDISQDGYAAGQLTSISIEANGIITARYSNGQTKPAAQIEIATFRNLQGLQPLGDNQWGRTFASGDPIVGAPGEANFGLLQSGALEESNVDLTAELVNMITAQRTYQANAQTIKTQDQVLQTLVNLR